MINAVNTTNTLNSSNSSYLTHNDSGSSQLLNASTKYAAGEPLVSSTVTNNQVINASKQVKNYISTYHKLPSTVYINGRYINMYTFLYMLSTAVQNVYNKNSSPIKIMNYNGPQKDLDTIIIGNMALSEYIHIADVVKVYMDKTGYVPGYATPTSLGTYFSWKSMIYMYSDVLSTYSSSGKLPINVLVKPWRVLSDPNWATFTNTQVTDAASWVKSYVESNHQLPGSVNIGGKTVSIYSFLYLLSYVLQNVYNHNTANVYTWSFNGPEIQKEDIRTGNMNINEYIHIADVVKVYMDKTNYIPGYAYPTSLGSYFGWQSMIYTFSKILDYYNVNSALPSTISVKPWAVVTNPDLKFRPVYITCDNIFSTTYDTRMVNSICDALRALGIYAVNWGLGPNTHIGVLKDVNVPQNALVVDIYGGACAGTLYEMGLNYYKLWRGSRSVFTIFICPPATRITGLVCLPRAHDDNFSPPSFTGLAHPDQYLLNNGYHYYECASDTSNPNNFNNIVNSMRNAIYNEAIL